MTEDVKADTQDEAVINQEAEKPAEAAAQDTPADQGAKAEEAAQSQEAGKETKTLLSDDEGDGAGAESAVPEKYEFQAPEDFTVSEEVQKKLDAFSDTARELGLTQEQYQKLVEYDIQRGREAVAEAAAGYTARIEGWADQVKADPELGGEALKANLAVASQAIEAFGSPELSKLIKAPSEKNPEGLGLGNHPEFIRFMYRVGRAIGEDKLIEGDGRKVETTDGLKRMYPTMFQEAS